MRGLCERRDLQLTQAYLRRMYTGVMSSWHGVRSRETEREREVKCYSGGCFQADYRGDYIRKIFIHAGVDIIG